MSAVSVCSRAVGEACVCVGGVCVRPRVCGPVWVTMSAPVCVVQVGVCLLSECLAWADVNCNVMMS